MPGIEDVLELRDHGHTIIVAMRHIECIEVSDNDERCFTVYLCGASRGFQVCRGQLEEVIEAYNKYYGVP